MLDVVDGVLLRAPQTPFVAMHAAVVLCAAEDVAGLATLATSLLLPERPRSMCEVVAPLALALRRLVRGEASGCADDLARLLPQLWRVGGSDAQREVIEETYVCALLRAGRYADALVVIDRRLDRRHCRRDEWFRAEAQAQVIES